MSQTTILVADDDKQLLTAVTKRLEHAGYQVVQARDGLTAVALAAETKPDLLIMDVHMPAADGFASIETMDNDPNLSSLPVIYITGDKTKDTANTAERHGAFAVLRKPLDMQQLLATIQAILASPCPTTQNESDLRDVA